MAGEEPGAWGKEKRRLIRRRVAGSSPIFPCSLIKKRINEETCVSLNATSIIKQRESLLFPECSRECQWGLFLSLFLILCLGVPSILHFLWHLPVWTLWMFHLRSMSFQAFLSYGTCNELQNVWEMSNALHHSTADSIINGVFIYRFYQTQLLCPTVWLCCDPSTSSTGFTQHLKNWNIVLFIQFVAKSGLQKCI